MTSQLIGSSLSSCLFMPKWCIASHLTAQPPGSQALQVATYVVPLEEFIHREVKQASRSQHNFNNPLFLSLKKTRVSLHFHLPLFLTFLLTPTLFSHQSSVICSDVITQVTLLISLLTNLFLITDTSNCSLLVSS